MNALWYLQRLIAMSPGEILHRACFQWKKNAWRSAAEKSAVFRDCAPNKPWNPQPFSYSNVEPSHPQARMLIDEAEKHICHVWNFFDLRDVAEPVIDWHFDPSSNLSAPQKFSYDIDHRDTASIGNAKVIWEKNRHHHLTALCAAYALTKNEKFAREAACQLLDWVAANPCLIGINWSHPLELGIRLISWIWCERLLRGSADYGKTFGPQSPIWLCIGQHQEIIARTYSRGSSANNHLIGEMAGLFCAAVAFPIYEKSRDWRELSRRILEREIVRQTFPSGINREMAFGYQLFVAEFLLLSVYESERAGIRFSGRFHSLLKKSLDAVVQLTDYGRLIPRYGDGDDGMALQLQSRLLPRENWILQLGSLLLGNDYPYQDETVLPMRLMGFNHDFKKSSGMEPHGSMDFGDAGIYILTNNRNTPKEVFVLADAGPLGYLSLAAHGHADALSFTLSAGGKPLLVDPGTYFYYAPPEWRNYFRGTRSHNTLEIDNCDQSKMLGMFLWSRKARAVATEWKPRTNGATLHAYHDGYNKHLGCVHSRSIDLSGSIVTITDTIAGNRPRFLRLCFHCDPHCSLNREAKNRIRIANDGVSALLTLPDTLEVVRKGEHLSGWFSPRFGVKLPAYTIFAEAQSSLPCSLTTTVEVFHEG